MAQPLNPEAAEFVPILATSPTGASMASRDGRFDDVLAQSPRPHSNVKMSLFDLPSDAEFANEITSRPGELSFENNNFSEKEKNIISADGNENIGNADVIDSNAIESLLLSDENIRCVNIQDDLNTVQKLPLSESDEETESSKKDMSSSFKNDDFCSMMTFSTTEESAVQENTQASLIDNVLNDVSENSKKDLSPTFDKEDLCSIMTFTEESAAQNNTQPLLIETKACDFDNDIKTNQDLLFSNKEESLYSCDKNNDTEVNLSQSTDNYNRGTCTLINEFDNSLGICDKQDVEKTEKEMLIEQVQKDLVQLSVFEENPPTSEVQAAVFMEPTTVFETQLTEHEKHDEVPTEQPPVALEQQTAIPVEESPVSLEQQPAIPVEESPVSLEQQPATPVEESLVSLEQQPLISTEEPLVPLKEQNVIPTEQLLEPLEQQPVISTEQPLVPLEQQSLEKPLTLEQEPVTLAELSMPSEQQHITLEDCPKSVAEEPVVKTKESPVCMDQQPVAIATDSLTLSLETTNSNDNPEQLLISSNDHIISAEELSMSTEQKSIAIEKELLTSPEQQPTITIDEPKSEQQPLISVSPVPVAQSIAVDQPVQKTTTPISSSKKIVKKTEKVLSATKPKAAPIAPSAKSLVPKPQLNGKVKPKEVGMKTESKTSARVPTKAPIKPTPAPPSSSTLTKEAKPERKPLVSGLTKSKVALTKTAPTAGTKPISKAPVSTARSLASKTEKDVVAKDKKTTTIKSTSLQNESTLKPKVDKVPIKSQVAATKLTNTKSTVSRTAPIAGTGVNKPKPATSVRVGTTASKPLLNKTEKEVSARNNKTSVNLVKPKVSSLSSRPAVKCQTSKIDSNRKNDKLNVAAKNSVEIETKKDLLTSN